MEIPNIFKGYYYPSDRTVRCPRFHRCVITNKCQNYDRHLLECNVCESRTDTHEYHQKDIPLGGHLPEGELYPDLQDAITTLERKMCRAFSHPDTEHQNTRLLDVADNYSKEVKLINMTKTFSSLGVLQMEEEIVNHYVDEETAKLLGRIE